MHEKEIFHGNLHGGNVLIRTGDQGDVPCLCDYAYTSLCPQEARTNLVHHSPVVCGTSKNHRISSPLRFFFSTRNSQRSTVFSIVGSLATRFNDLRLVNFFSH